VDRNRDFTGSFRSNAAKWDSADPPATGSPAVEIRNIEWDNDDEGNYEDEFWLFVCEDTNGDSVYSPGSDRVLPSMKIVLRDNSDGAVTEIRRLDFTGEVAALNVRQLSIPIPTMNDWGIEIGVFIEDPSLVDATHPVFIEYFDTSNGATNKARFCVRISDPQLLAGLYARVDNTITYVLAFWDKDVPADPLNDSFIAIHSANDWVSRVPGALTPHDESTRFHFLVKP